MRVRQLLIAATAAVALYASNASAILYVDAQDYTQYGATLGQHVVQGQLPFLDTFNIVTGTADPGYPNAEFPTGIDTSGYVVGDTILTAYAKFTFDPGDGTFLDPDTGLPAYQIQIDLGHGPAQLFDRKYLIDLAGYSSSFGNLAGSLILTVQKTGKLDFEVQALDGDFYLTAAELYVNTAGAYTTPDGGITVALLGLGCLGLVGVGRRFAI